MSPPARLSVVVITRNRQPELCRTLQSLADLPERPAVIVVDNGSTDDSVACSREFPNVTVIEAGLNLGADARRLGLAHARTPYVAFADDDIIWRGGSLAYAAKILDEFPRVAILTAKVLVGEAEEMDPVCIEMAHSPLSPKDEVPGRCLVGFLAGASIVRREAVLPALEATPRKLIIGGEEEWIAADVLARGWDICYVPELVAHHYPSPVRDPARRRRLQLRNAIWFAFLRRPLRSAIRRALALAITAPGNNGSLWTCAAALCALPWLLPERRVVSPYVENLLRQVDGSSRSPPGAMLSERMDVQPCSMPSPLPAATCQPGHSA